MGGHLGNARGAKVVHRGACQNALMQPDPGAVRGEDPAARVAFVLGGGGVLGATQVGMLRALLEAGRRPDLVVGTSVGALNGAALAADPSPGRRGRGGRDVD